MKYMGGKFKIAKHIVPIIQQKIDDNNIQQYLEPFVGGANIIDKVRCEVRIGADNNKYLIALYNNLDKVVQLPNESPTKEEYDAVRMDYNNGGVVYSDWYIGAIGFLCSYNGRFFDGGYSGKRLLRTGEIRDYWSEAKRNLENQIPMLNGVGFERVDYRIWRPKNALIYCDPPYFNTKQYNTSKNFDHAEFWEWCKEMSRRGNIVLVSEQECPLDKSEYDILWEKEAKRTIDCNGTKNNYERLFELKY